MIRVLLTGLLALVLIAGISIGGALWYVQDGFERPGPLTREQVVLIPRGAGVGEIARRLEAHGVVEGALAFEMAIHLNGAAGQLKAGEYAFPAAASPRQVLDILRAGKTHFYAFTLPEGRTTWEALEQINRHEDLAGDYLTPQSVPFAEGILLPETYHFGKGYSRRQLFERLRSEMERVITELWPTRQPDLPIKTRREAVILASIVEKETGLATERSRVASVFINRLKKGMKLQTDPTVIYAVTQGRKPLGRPISKSDLATKSPYNTYYVKGLPPGPIANPGLASLKAVLNPEQTDYLFFVAKCGGGHAFSTNYEDHKRHVAALRKGC